MKAQAMLWRASGVAVIVLGGYVAGPSLSELWDSFPIGTGVGLHTWATLVLCLLAIGTGIAVLREPTDEN